MKDIQNDSLLQMKTTCGTLLCELKIIWDEMGETEDDRDKVLLELERECLELYRRKVDKANHCRAQLHQAIADAEAELATICSSLGEPLIHIRQTEKKTGTLREELNKIHPQLEEMRKRKLDRKNQFLDLIGHIQSLSTEVYGSAGYDSINAIVNEDDLSLRRFEELQSQLQSLQKEKSVRLKQVMEHLSDLSSLCSVLGLNFKETVRELHPSFADSDETHSITTNTLQQMECAIRRLQELKRQRMRRLQDLATMLLELWNLMDTPVEEQQAFQSVTCNVAASEDEITDPNMLSKDFIKYVEAEASRLEELKSSKMKELVLKKRAELEEICQKTHVVIETDCETEYLLGAIESGALDPASVLEQIELEIAKLKEEAFSRREILEKVEKWLSAREEEEWLEQYNMDENRYNAGKGAHLILKRAEKARTLVNKLPGMVETLAAKTLTWENERDVEFMYDGIRLLSTLEEYIILRQEKEQEKKRQREQKKLQGQLIAEQEALFGSKPSPLKSAKKSSRMSVGGGNGGGTKRLSVGGNMLQTPRPDSAQSARAAPNSRPVKKDDNSGIISTANRGLDIGSLPVKNSSFNGREPEPTVSRRPFSPISSAASTRANGDLFDDQNMLHSDTMQKTLSKIVVSNSPLLTSKTIPAADEENHTPQLAPVPASPTPSTASDPIQPLIKPARPHEPLNGDNNSIEGAAEEIEYSFEERRAGFVVPNAQLRRAIQV